MPEEIYFSHDANASIDPNILKMRAAYGWQGYGWYWALVEMMRTQTDHDYALAMRSQCEWNAFAMLMQCDASCAKKYIEDCIDLFNLFECDGDVFWSKSLRRRMKKMQQKTDQAKAAAEARWASKHSADADAMRQHSGSNADAMRQQCKEKKVKEKKVNNIPSIVPQEVLFDDHVLLTEAEHQKLISKHGEAKTQEMIEILDSTLGAHFDKEKGAYRKPYNYTSHYDVLKLNGWVDCEYRARHLANKAAPDKTPDEDQVMQFEPWEREALKSSQERDDQYAKERAANKGL